MNKRNLLGLILINCAFGLVPIGCGKPAIGLNNGELMPCPKSPNCVCSYETDKIHYEAPLTYAGSAEDARRALLSILDSMPRARVVEKRNDYIHVEFRSKIFRFVDDVEFQFIESEPVIHLRSASRLGYSDFGVNRKRIDEIRRLFNEKMDIDVKK